MLYEFRGIGARIVDGILITNEGSIDLSTALPGLSHGIEVWMDSAGSARLRTAEGKPRLRPLSARLAPPQNYAPCSRNSHRPLRTQLLTLPSAARRQTISFR